MGVENSPGHPEEETGARMERLLSQFEGGEAHSTFNLIGTLIESSIMHDGETVEGIARSPQHLAKTVLLQKLPDLVDRELLAGAIEKKYIYREPEEKPNDGSTPEKVSKWMERYLEAEKTYDKQMDQGLTYKPFIELAKTHEKAWIIVDFITKLDDAVVAEGKGVNSPDGLEEIKRQVAESQEQAKREIQERAWNIFASCEVSFHDENARGLVLPLKQFAESIIYDDLDQHEQIKRLDRLSAELKKALTLTEREALLEKLTEEETATGDAEIKAGERFDEAMLKENLDPEDQQPFLAEIEEKRIEAKKAKKMRFLIQNAFYV